MTKIIMDTRELRSPVAKALDRLGIEIQFETLPVADYVLSDRVAAERKTIDDFWNSFLVEKKLFGQLLDLTQYERPILIIEGYENELFTARRIDPRAVEGILNSIALMRIPVRYTVNPVGTANVLASMARKEQGEDKRAVSYHGKRSHLSKHDQLVYIISAIPDIGTTTAKELLRHFGDIEHIATAGISELMACDGVGEKTACAIRNTMTEHF